VFDAGVVVECVNLRGEYYELAEAVFGALLVGGLEAIIPHLVLVEAFYVVAGIYRELGLDRLEGRGERVV